MDRRSFLLASVSMASATVAKTAPLAPASPRFKLNYAPHFGMFAHQAGQDPIDQIRFMADQGFRAMEDNGMKDRPIAEQERIAGEMARLGMTMGVFVATADFANVTFASTDATVRGKLLADIRASVEVAKRVNARWCTVVPGRFDLGLQWEYQTANVIDNLKRCCELLEPNGVVMVLEPLNAWHDHPGLFLSRIPQASMICRAVDSPSCKILFDIYHQQISEGNLIPNMDQAWDDIAYFQIGDNPGRKEPTTGEINYQNIFKHLHGKGYGGILGMEHGNSRPGVEGEKAVVEAYLRSDDF